MSNDYSLLFDGTDDYVSIPHSSNLSLTNFTIETWVNPSQIKGDWQPLINKEDSSVGSRNYGLFIAPNEMRVLFSFLGIYGDWRYDYSISSLKLNQWNHIAMTYDGSQFNFYFNGVLEKSYNFVTVPIQNTEPVKIGKEVNAWNPFAGKMDEVRIWNKARTQAEIQADMNHQLTGTESGLIGYWQFSEGTGNTVTDLSGHNNNGIINGATYTEGFFGSSVLSLSQPTYSIRENGAASVQVTVIRTGGFSGEVSATLNLSGGTATLSQDYSQSSVTVSFASGEAQKIVTIPLIDDFDIEGDETVNLSLSNPTTGAIIGEQSTAILTINDNDFDWYDPKAWSNGVVPANGSQIGLNFPGEKIKYTFSQGNPSLNVFSLYARDKGVLELPGLTAYTIPFTSVIEVKGTGSEINLSSLATMTGATYRGWDTRNGWDYNYLDVHGIEGGKLDLSGLETITSGATVIYADGNNSVVDLSNLTSWSDDQPETSSLSVANGGTVILDKLTTLQGIDQITANTGGYIDLSDVTTLNSNNTQIIADGTGSIIDLSNLTSFTGLTFTATNGGVIRVRPVSRDDAYQLNEDSTLTIAAAQGVLANDINITGQPLILNPVLKR
jgi:hypothetical protein